MPTDPKPRGTANTSVVPSQVPFTNVADADPTVQRALQVHAETINAILKVFNDNFKRTPIGVAIK